MAERIWLDWRRPALAQAALWLVARGSPDGSDLPVCDLEQFVCVLPGRRAGRALLHHLLHPTGVFRIAPLMRERRVHVNDKPAGYIGTVGVGAAFGAGWTPCIGPVLGAILTLAGTQDTVWAGVGLLSVYSLGLAIPFLISALALDWFLGVFSRFRWFLPMVEKASGVILILLGVLLATGQLTILSSYLTRFTPDWILNRI